MTNSTSHKQPIFIVGTPRSGTTLTAKILGLHSDIFMPGETHFFPDIYSHRKAFGDPPTEESADIIYARFSDLYERYNEPEDQKRVDDILSDKDMRSEFKAACASGYKDAFGHFMAMQMRVMGKQRWGNNAPRDLFHIDEILSFYRDAKFILCVRDPRDYLLSYKGKWKVTREDNVERLRKLYHPIITTMLWKASMRQVFYVLERIPVTQRCLVHYENLVRDPESNVRAICSYLDIGFQETMLEISSHNSSEAGQTQGIFTSSIGRWREGLSAAEATVVQQLARREMTTLNYKIEESKPNLRELSWIYLSTPSRLYAALQANAAITGPLIPYLVRRARAFLR